MFHALKLTILAAVFAVGCSSAQKMAGGVKVVGDHLEFEQHINFASGEATILADSHELLDNIALVLKAEQNLAKVHVHGHTDKTGSMEANQALSEKRAQAVADYLKGKGVEAELMAAGFGQTKLLCEEETEDCHAKNRRVEFMIERKS